MKTKTDFETAHYEGTGDPSHNDTTPGLGGIPDFRELNINDIKNIAQGACFLASGGGGSLRLALKRIIPVFFDARTRIKLAGLGDLGWEGDWGCVVAGIGSPLKMFEDPGLVRSTVPVYEKLRELVQALKAAGDQRFASFRLMNFCLPVEAGAINSIVPMIVANAVPPVTHPWHSPVVVVDADGAGRAIPILPLTNYARRIPLYPNVLGGNNNTKDGSDFFDYASLNVEDETTLSKAFLSLIGTRAFGDVSGLGIYTADGPTFQQCGLVPNGISDALAIGRIINATTSRARVDNILDHINSNMGRTAKEIFYGEVSKMAVETASLDEGYVLISGKEAFAGQTLKLHIHNENMWGEITENGMTKPYIMGPDSINFLTQTGDVVDNSDLWTAYQKGDRPTMSIIAIKAASEIIDNTELTKGWEEEIAKQKGPSIYSSPWAEG